MTTTVVEISPRGDAVTWTLSGDLVVPRLVRRRGRSVDVALVAGRAMLLPGDDVRIRISVGPDCTLNLVDIGGLVVYGRDGHHGEPSQWHASITLDAGAHLTWDALPTVVTDPGVLTRTLSVAVGHGSSATLRETLVLGRAGERGGRVHAEADISDTTGPVLRETFDVRGDEPVPGVLGGLRVMDTVVAVGERGRLVDVEGASRLDLERGGTVLRYLGDAAHESPLGAAWLDLSRRDEEAVHVA